VVHPCFTPPSITVVYLSVGSYSIKSAVQWPRNSAFVDKMDRTRNGFTRKLPRPVNLDLANPTHPRSTRLTKSSRRVGAWCQRDLLAPNVTARSNVQCACLQTILQVVSLTMNQRSTQTPMAHPLLHARRFALPVMYGMDTLIIGFPKLVMRACLGFISHIYRAIRA